MSEPMDIDAICRSGHCCSCQTSMKQSKEVNWIPMNKVATWTYPYWDNLFLRPEYLHVRRAISMVCDSCLGAGKFPKFAIKIVDTSEGKRMEYIPLSTLQDTFPVTPDMVNVPAGNAPPF